MISEKKPSVADCTDAELAALGAELEGKSALERVRWGHERFGGGLVMSTSFGVQSAVLLHLGTRVNPEIPVVFIDTGYLFKETYLFAAQLTDQLGLNLKKYHPKMSAAEQEALYGKLWEKGGEGLEQYNFIRKVEPMNRALTELGASAWMAGLRASQSDHRSGLGVIQRQGRMIKLHPILEWSSRDVYEYMKAHDLPYHPLWEQGYVSVGDVHTTRKLEPGMNASDTRFFGVKRECGLHELSGRRDFQI